MAYPYASDTQEVVSRLRKIEGQIRGVARMVEDAKDPVDILTQVSAVVSGMRKVGLRVLRAHMEGSLSARADRSRARQTEVDELLRAVERFLQT